MSRRFHHISTRVSVVVCHNSLANNDSHASKSPQMVLSALMAPSPFSCLNSDGIDHAILWYLVTCSFRFPTVSTTTRADKSFLKRPFHRFPEPKVKREKSIFEMSKSTIQLVLESPSFVVGLFQNVENSKMDVKTFFMKAIKKVGKK